MNKGTELVRKLLAICGLYIAVAPLAAAAASSYQTRTFLSEIDAGTGRKAAYAYIDEPLGFDQSGAKDIYLVDTVNNAVEKIDYETRKLTRVAGTNEYGYVDGKAKDAQFAHPEDISVRGENAREIFVADTENNVIRKIAKGIVSTFLKGLKSPKGVLARGGTLYVSDTGNNRILAYDRDSGKTVTAADGLSAPTKLVYCDAVERLLFVNSGEPTIRALNLKTGKISQALTSGLEDIGGMYCSGRTLYVASSYSIGVFNQIIKVRLSKGGDEEVEALSQTEMASYRETEHMNWPSDITMREDTLDWEEYYTWEENLLYDTEEASAEANTTADRKQKKQHRTSTKEGKSEEEELQCLDIRKKGQDEFRDTWYVSIDPEKMWQKAEFALKREYQGDRPFFKVNIVYENSDVDKEERDRLREENQSNWKKSKLIQSLRRQTSTSALSAPSNLTTVVRQPRKLTLGWDAVSGASTYNLQFYKGEGGEKRLFSLKSLTSTQAEVKKFYLKANTAYGFTVQSCAADGTCGDYADLYEFRTPPGAAEEVSRIVPKRAINFMELENGDFLATFKFRLPENTKHYPRENTAAKVQLCTKYADHPKTVTANRLYVLYKGGSSILAWRENARLPLHYAGKHRFQDDFGSKAVALVGRPKAIAFSSDGKKMYISQNNKFTVYDFEAKKLKPLAGHVMDSYVEGEGDTVRVSDVTDMVISSDDKWLYFVDRNNNRIRKLNTSTGKSKYITGAGATNFSFGSSESNGYQEGKACKDEFEQGKKSCAYFYRPTGIALSPDDTTLYVAEGSNNRIRAVDVDSGDTRLIAGSGTAGLKDGSGANAQFNGPYSLDVSSDGKYLYVADKYNHAIRRIDLSNNAVTTLFGKGTIGLRDGSWSSAVLAIPEYIREENGMLYWTEAGSHTIRAASLSGKTVFTVSGTGDKGFRDGAGNQALWNGPKGFDFRGGKMYVSDYANDLIRTISL